MKECATAQDEGRESGLREREREREKLRSKERKTAKSKD